MGTPLDDEFEKDQAHAAVPEDPHAETIQPDESATLAAYNTLGLGLGSRVLAARDAVLGEDSAKAAANEPRGPWETLKALYTAVKEKHEHPFDQPLGQMGDLYAKNKQFYDQGFQRANEENPKASFAGNAVAALAQGPRTAAQGVIGGVANALGGTGADYGKVAQADPEALKHLGKDVGVSGALAGAGMKAPIATGLGTVGYAALAPGLSDTERQQLGLQGATGILAGGAARALGVTAHGAKALEEANTEARGKIGEQINAEDAKNQQPAYALNKKIDKSGVPAAVYGQESPSALAKRGLGLKNAYDALHPPAITNELVGEHQIRGKFGDILGDRPATPGALRRVVEAAIARQRANPGSPVSPVEKAAADYQAALAKANEFEQGIPGRVAAKNNAEFGALVHRMATLKALGHEVPPELNEAMSRYQTNSPEIVREFLSEKNPDALSEKYRQELLAEHQGMLAKAEAMKPGENQAPNPVSMEQALRQAGPQYHEAAQYFPDLEKTHVSAPEPEPTPAPAPQPPEREGGTVNLHGAEEASAAPVNEQKTGGLGRLSVPPPTAPPAANPAALARIKAATEGLNRLKNAALPEPPPGARPLSEFPESKPMSQRINERAAQTPFTRALLGHDLLPAHTAFEAFQNALANPALRVRVLGKLNAASQVAGSAAAGLKPVLQSIAQNQSGPGLAHLMLLVKNNPELQNLVSGVGQEGEGDALPQF